MATVTVRKIENEKPGPLLGELSQMVEQIRNRAFERFERRGGAPDQETNDWLRAERDLFSVPLAELSETNADFSIRVAVPGFDSRSIQVIAQSGEVLVLGSAETPAENTNRKVCYTDFEQKPLYRRFDLTAAIDLERTAAHVENGLLTITALKKKTSEIAKKAAA